MMQYPRGERKFLHAFSYSFSPGKMPFIYKADLDGKYKWCSLKNFQKISTFFIFTSFFAR